MLWKLQYSDYRIESEVAQNKADAFGKAIRTLSIYPYLSVDFYKFRGDEKIYVTTYNLSENREVLVEKRSKTKR